MGIQKYFLNLERCQDRAKKFDDSWIRFPATEGSSLPQETKDRMVSMWNISDKEHNGKCGCFQSHYNLLRHISNNKLNHAVIVEDDAVPVVELPEDFLLTLKNFTYLGGYFSHLKMKDGPLRQEHEFPLSTDGINQLDRSTHRILMTLAYYIPHWTIARDILEYLDSKHRVRAIDVMLHKIIKVPQDYYYPALFIEEDTESTIHKKSRDKHPDQFYNLQSKT